MNAVRRGRGRRTPGQALVEFSLVLPIFVLLILIVFDFGRGVYTFNGVSEAAREIARTTIVNPGLLLGDSVATQRTVATQKGLVPGLQVVSYECLEFDGTPSTDDPCISGDLVKVTVQSTYNPTAMLGLGGPIQLTASSSLQVP
jgi:hypothetical protein